MAISQRMARSLRDRHKWNRSDRIVADAPLAAGTGFMDACYLANVTVLLQVASTGTFRGVFPVGFRILSGSQMTGA
jgi:hypothetical protein